MSLRHPIGNVESEDRKKYVSDTQRSSLGCRSKCRRPQQTDESQIWMICTGEKVYSERLNRA